MTTVCDIPSGIARKICALPGMSHNCNSSNEKRALEALHAGGWDAKSAPSPPWAAAPAEAGLLIPQLRAGSKLAAIKELINRLHHRGVTTDSLQFLQSVLEREGLSSTIAGSGVALPHARCRSVRRLAWALAVTVPAVEYASGDEVAPVDIIGLIAVPGGASGPYLRLLGTLARHLQEPQIRTRLRAARTEEEIEAVLQCAATLDRAAGRPQRDILSGGGD